jgi:transcriptional regulator with XRE-family HTH domain
MHIGKHFADKRRVKGLSLADVMRETGISRSHLSKIETGKVQDPGFYSVVQIARVLDIEITWLAATAENSRPG